MDASVAVKWFLPENGAALASQALSLLESFDREEVRFAVPDLFYAETATRFGKRSA